MNPYASPASPRAEGPPFTVLFAAVITVLTGIVYSLVTLMIHDAMKDTLLPVERFLFAHALGLMVAFGNSFALVVRRFPEPPMTALALCAPPQQAWFAALLMVPALLLVSELDNCVVALLPALRREPAPPGDAAASASEPLALLLLIGVVLQPLIHEGFFRGVLHGRFQRIWSGTQTVILATSLFWVFAAISFLLVPTQPLLALVRISVHALGQGALLGVLRQASGSLYPPLLLSALFGVVQALGADERLAIPGFDDASAPHTPGAYLLPAGLLTAAGLWLCQRMAQRVPSEP